MVEQNGRVFLQPWEVGHVFCAILALVANCKDDVFHVCGHRKI